MQIQHAEHFRGTLFAKTSSVEKLAKIIRYPENVDDPSIIQTILPHADFGGEDCCGCLTATIITDTAVLSCNECGFVVKMVPAADIHRAIAQLETQVESTTAICPHCGAENTLLGMSEALAFTCRNCGRGADLTK